MLEIDGSYGEGGGQLSRYAMALAAITGKAIHLTNMRAKRAKPGLMPQHLTALKAVAAVSGGELEGAALGATALRFQPGRIRGGEYAFHVGTAGSIVLVLQALLPVAFHAREGCWLHITGGTDLRMAPPWDYLRMIFLPWLARMGMAVRIEEMRRGYYPRGGGAVTVTVSPCATPKPLIAERAGALRRIDGVAHVANLPAHIAQRMAAAASAELAEMGQVDIALQYLGGSDAFGPGGAIVLAAQTEYSVLGGAAVAERGVPAERLGQDAARALRQELETHAAVDVHAADQLPIYAAQSRGESRVRVRELSLHAQTVLWLLRQFLPIQFQCHRDSHDCQLLVINQNDSAPSS